MAAIQPNEYNADYFDGKLSATPHAEGYLDYSLHEHMLTEVENFTSKLNPSVLATKKVLEIGCAKGFLVQKLRDLGIDTYGIDVSQYAIDVSPSEVKPYISVGDVRDLSAYKSNEFDYLFSVRVLICLDPNELDSVIAEMNKISKNQIHIVDEPTYGDTNYYILQPLSWWAQKDFDKGTILISYQTEKRITI